MSEEVKWYGTCSTCGSTAGIPCRDQRSPFPRELKKPHPGR